MAFAMQEAVGASKRRRCRPAAEVHLRIGIHVSPLSADEHDIYGHGVNLAARLTTLAGPDEIVVSADVRDQLTPALDADIEDLGECYVKHVQQPVRAFRVGAPGDQPVIERGNLAEDLRATIAVIPFRPRALQVDRRRARAVAGRRSDFGAVALAGSQRGLAAVDVGFPGTRVSNSTTSARICGPTTSCPAHITSTAIA